MKECTNVINCPNADRITRLEEKVDKIESTLDKLLWGIMGTLLTSFSTLLIILLTKG